LQRYLLSGKLARPTVIDKSAESGEGVVLSNVEHGEIFLKNAAGKAYRLRWKKSDKARERLLPPGRYSLLGYRVIKGKWMISSTSNGRTKVVVQADKPLQLNIDPTIHFSLKARKMRGKQRLQMGITNNKHQGLSIYYKGRRIPLPWKVTGNGGRTLASGMMEYG